MRHHHVAEGADRLVEPGPLAETEGLGHVDLHVVDEVAVPDRLEEAVGEAEREDVLRGLLAEKVIDPEDLLLAEHLVDLRVQRHRALEVGAERLLHDDARPLDEARVAERPHGGQRRAGRHAQVVQATTLPRERPLGLVDRRLQGLDACRERDVVEDRGKGRPVGLRHRAGRELVERSARHLAEAVGVEIVERDADDPAGGDEPGPREMEETWQQLASRQVARGAEEHDELGVPRAHA